MSRGFRETVERIRSFARTSAETGGATFASAGALRALQERKLRALLRHAAARSSFYRERLRGLDVERCALTDVPPVTKEEIQARLDDVVTDGRLRKADILSWVEKPQNLGRLYLDEFVPITSSGTSGRSGLTVYARGELDPVQALFAQRGALPSNPTHVPTARESLQYLARSLVHKNRLANVFCPGGASHVVSLQTPSFNRLFVEERTFSTLAGVEELVARLNDFAPKSLVCYPTVMRVLALEQLAGRLRLELDDPYSILYSMAEPLDDATRRLAREAWGIPVHDYYALSECLTVGRTCAKFDRLHVMTDQCVLEVVDAQGRPVPDGQMGAKILLTNLSNHTQPLIRYEVADVTGYSTETCGCRWSFPTLMRVEGRGFDVFYIDGKQGEYEPVPHLRLWTPIGFTGELDGIRRCRIVQIARNDFVFQYAAERSDRLHASVARALERRLADVGLAGRVSFTIEAVDDIPLEPSGKFRQFVSLVGAPRGVRTGYERPQETSAAMHS